jgi:hypothetical protein
MKFLTVLGVFLTAVILAVIAFVILVPGEEEKPIVNVASYEDCVGVNGTVSESYPSICTTDEGEKFTQDIGNELDKRDLIRIETPRPGQKISSPLHIRGEARGNWYFEASFPVRLIDSEGNTIAESHAESEGEWMTTDFVPFNAVLEFETEQKKGTLILEKDNPSGLSHDADQLEIPVNF